MNTQPRSLHLRRRATSAAALLSFAVAVAGLLAPTTPTTLAAFTNAGNLTGTTLTSYTVAATTLSCAKQASNSRFTWTAVTGATSYTISFTGGTAKSPVTQATTTYTDTAPSAGRTATVVVSQAFTNVTWTSVASNTASETASNGTCS